MASETAIICLTLIVFDMQAENSEEKAQGSQRHKISSILRYESHREESTEMLETTCISVYCFHC